MVGAAVDCVRDPPHWSFGRQFIHNWNAWSTALFDCNIHPFECNGVVLLTSGMVDTGQLLMLISRAMNLRW